MNTEIDSLDEVNSKSADPKTTKTAPYMSYRGFQTLLEKLISQGIPGRFDASYFGAQSGSLIAQTRGTLRYFEFIDDEMIPTDVLRQVVNSDDAGRKARLRRLFDEKYKDALALSSDATSGQLAEVFRSRGLSGATVMKATNFFLGMAEDVGVELSPYFKKRLVKAASSTSRRKRLTKSPQPDQTPTLVPHQPQVSTKEQQRAKYVEMLMELVTNNEGDVQADLLDRIERALEYETPEANTLGPKDSP